MTVYINIPISYSLLIMCPRSEGLTILKLLVVIDLVVPIVTPSPTDPS